MNDRMPQKLAAGACRSVLVMLIWVGQVGPALCQTAPEANALPDVRPRADSIPNSTAVNSDSTVAMELKHFGRILREDDVDLLRSRPFWDMTSSTLSAMYSVTGRHSQKLRLCRLRERAVANDAHRKVARECQVAALMDLNRISEAETLALEIGLVSPPPKDMDAVEGIRRWSLIGALAESNGEISLTKHAARRVLELSTQAKARPQPSKPEAPAAQQRLEQMKQEFIQYGVLDARRSAHNFLARAAYHEQDTSALGKYIDILLSERQQPLGWGGLAVDLALRLEQLGASAKARQMAHDALAEVRAAAGFRDQPEPLRTFQLLPSAVATLGDERSQGIFVREWVRLASVYRMLGRFDESNRLLAESHAMSVRYQLEDAAANTLTALVERTQARLSLDLDDRATALKQLRSARSRLQNATQYERAFELGRRRIRFDDELLAVGAEILGILATDSRQPVTEPRAIDEVLSILADHSASRAERSTLHSAARLRAADPELRSLLSMQGLQVDRLMDLRGALSAQAAASGAGAVDVPALQAELSSTLKQLKGLADEIAQRWQGAQLSTASLRFDALSRALAPGEVLWQWVFHPLGNVSVAITREGMWLAPLGVDANSIRRLADGLAQAASLRRVNHLSQLRPYPERKAEQVYSGLFAAIAAQLPKSERWILVPSPTLDRLPWAALRTTSTPGRSTYTRGGWLVQQVALSLTPSIISWVEVGNRPASAARQSLFAIGQPLNPSRINTEELRLRGSVVTAVAPSKVVVPPGDLSFAAEIDAVARMFPARTTLTLKGPSATKAALGAAALHDYRVLLFSTHGYLAGDVYASLGPALELTGSPREPRERFLTAPEIISLKLDADVVFLSACDTSGSDGSLDAEGFSGLTSAFFLAGARSVVATLWPVETKVTTTFTKAAMQAYLARPELPFAFALREAMLHALKSPELAYQHPAFWSGFVVVGR